ncbi:OmpA family protein [Halomonas piscis]|uniref:OmpA family protein n=1 Tax=Halomonas piscis TaxID=3031727 RepID=A0ABY9YZZ0_9GAMM|nr:OmpA family protein [Halomonas piscis]WNK20417.1 OmpA family protein [Halomonas piscis]
MKYGLGRRAMWTLGIAGFVILSLQGCTTTAGQGPAVDSYEVAFPDIDDAWQEKGTFVNIENLSQMHAGLSKEQVYDLLGRPHFQEGLFGVHQWDYIFHFRTGEAADYVTCQYQVHFDSNMQTESLHWRNKQCADFLTEEEPEEPQQVTLSADTLFDFDSAELSANGQRVVTDAGHRIQQETAAANIVVTGYTDRIGRTDYNQRLSRRRADSVRDALVRTGIDPRAIRSRGAGERNPVERCEGERVTPQLKACLRPNRRVEIEVTGING